jgi:chromosomal replication initiation ATPase DnaA
LYSPSARAREFAEALGSLGASLQARLGPDLARSWFGKAVITDFVRDTLTIEMPTRFSAHRVKSDYEHAVRACCSALVPAIKSIRIVVAARAGAAA